MRRTTAKVSFGPSTTMTSAGDRVMKATRSPKKGALGVLGVVRLRHLGGDGPQLGGHQAQVLALEPRHDLADQAALDAVGLHNDKGAVHEESRLHNRGGRSRSAAGFLPRHGGRQRRRRGAAPTT